MTPLDSLNAMTAPQATQWLLTCCAAERWAATVAAQRPFDNGEALLGCAREVWATMADSDRLEAFAAHPLIGDVELLRARFGDGEDRANQEQGQVLDAQEQVLQALAAGNAAYHARHGFIFIVFASGKSAAEMLDLLQQRLPNSTAAEMQTAAAEQMKITELRIAAKLDASKMTITLSTHILNQADGQPAAGVAVTLCTAAGATIGAATTDADGRIGAWPDADNLPTGEYQLLFDTGSWFAGRGEPCFYPRVRIEFNAGEARHYHVPLLLNRYGYSTYRGS